MSEERNNTDRFYIVLFKTYVGGGVGIASPLILMLTADRRIDRRILQEADTLETRGMRVTILAMPHDNKEELEDPRVVRIKKEEFGGLRESIVVDLYRFLRKWMAMNGPRMLWLKRIAWRWVVRPKDFYLQLFWATAVRYQPSIVVAHDLPMLPVAVGLAERSNAKVIYDSHELYIEQGYDEREKQAWQELEARYIHKADAVITVNQSIAEELVSRYSISRAEVILNAERKDPKIDNKKQLHAQFGLTASRKILLFQGGITAGRNLETMVRAIELVRNKEIVLVMLGEGILQRSLERLVKKLGLRDRVFWDSLPEAGQRRALTASADGGVIPYKAECLNNYYCTPNKLFEYIAAGLPILATALPELQRFVEGYEIGLTGDTSTPDSMAQLIDCFFENEIELSKWREKVKLARESVNWESEEQKLEEIYKQLLAET